MWGQVMHALAWVRIVMLILQRTGTPIVHEREIWWCNVGYNIGYEVYGKGSEYQRPVLIVKKFNNRMVFAVPLSTQVRPSPYRIPFVFQGVERVALLNQVRCFDTKRFTKSMGVLPTDDFELIKYGLQESLFETT